MKVEHDVGINREMHQGCLLALESVRRVELVDAMKELASDTSHIRCYVVIERFRHTPRHCVREIRPAAVEVTATAKFVTADEAAGDVLIETDRVRHRHEHDLARYAAGMIHVVQQADQVMKSEHAGQFVGVEAGLQVCLGPGAGSTVTVHHERSRRPRTSSLEGNSEDVLGH